MHSTHVLMLDVSAQPTYYATYKIQIITDLLLKILQI